MGTKSKSPFRRIGSKLFGGRSQPGFIPDPNEITEFIAASSPRLTRQKAQSEDISIPEIWPLK